MKNLRFVNPTQFDIQGQWWSMFSTHLWQVEQWWHLFLFYLLPFWLKTMTKQTISSSPVLALLCEKSPIYRHSPWISDNRFDIAPD
jgi:hypothetical protein